MMSDIVVIEDNGRREPLPRGLLVLKYFVEVFGPTLQLINSLCNLSILILLPTIGGPGLKVFTIVHALVVAFAALVLLGIWLARGRDTTGVPRWYREAKAALVAPITLPVYFLVPLLSTITRSRSSAEVEHYRQAGNNQTKGAAARVVREEEESLRKEASLASWLCTLDFIIVEPQWLQLIQLGLEGVPLMITQLVMMVTGVLSVGSPAEESHLEPIRVLCYVSMCTVFLHLAFRGYMVCQSVDLQVFAIRWLFVLFDLTSMLYLLVFITTVGKPFASFEALINRDFSGGCTLSQVWMVGYLAMASMVLLLLLALFVAIVKGSGCDRGALAMLCLAIALIVPGTFTLFGAKLILFNIGIVYIEPYTMKTAEGMRDNILFFGFMRRAAGSSSCCGGGAKEDWNNRVQHVCRYFHGVVKLGKSKGPYSFMEDYMRRSWKELYGSDWQKVHHIRGWTPKQTAYQAGVQEEEDPETELRREFILKNQFLHPNRWSNRSCNDTEIILALAITVFVVFQLGFTLFFPFLAFALNSHSQNAVLKALFGLLCVEVLLMLPLLNRFWCYVRHLAYLGPLMSFMYTCELFLEHGGPKDGSGKEIPVIDAAIQAYYVPPHEKAVVWALSPESTDAVRGMTPTDTALGGRLLIPHDVILRVAAFSAEKHINLDHLSRQEALAIKGHLGDEEKAEADPEDILGGGEGGSNGTPHEEEERPPREATPLLARGS
jgi:hypothetical protein